MRIPAKFSLEAYLSRQPKSREGGQDLRRYEELADHVRAALDREWDRADDLLKSSRLAREKGAIMGIERDAEDLRERIRMILTRENLLAEPYPSYYPSLTDALFSDLYGLSGIAPWAFGWTEEYRRSSSAKLIGDRLYCLIDGKTVLQPQRISQKRRGQLIHALLLASPRERKETGFHEVYLSSGIRVTIYSGERTKPGQDIIVFRKYLISRPDLASLAALGTFPPEAVPLFRAMCAIGFNVVFAGQVRSGKTTFLQAWQACEDPHLEGVAVATDPETRWDLLMPDVPMMQLVADGKQLSQIEKSLKRSDADYVILEEMRDAASYDLFLAITSLGTMRSKGTIHDSSALNIPYKMAAAIASAGGGSEDSLIARIFSNINYVFELCQLPGDRSQKRLTGIVEFGYDAAEDRVFARRICQRDPASDRWSWSSAMGRDKEAIAAPYPDQLEIMKKTLAALEKASPLKDGGPVYPAYYRGNRAEGKEAPND